MRHIKHFTKFVSIDNVPVWYREAKQQQQLYDNQNRESRYCTSEAVVNESHEDDFVTTSCNSSEGIILTLPPPRTVVVVFIPFCQTLTRHIITQAQEREESAALWDSKIKSVKIHAHAACHEREKLPLLYNSLIF